MASRSTGERMIPEYDSNDLVYAEHMVRYYFARQFVKGKKVLDIACGAGYGSAYLADYGEAAEVVGVDKSSEAIAYAKKHYARERVTFLAAEAASLDFRPETFDVIVSFETIEHVDHAENFLAEMRRVLRKGGTLVLSTPNALVYPKGNPFHVREFTPDELRERVHKVFPHAELLYQHARVALCIVKEGEGNVVGHTLSTESINLVGLDEKDNKYLMVVASDAPVPSIRSLHALFNDRPLVQLERIYKMPMWRFLWSIWHRIRVVWR